MTIIAAIDLGASSGRVVAGLATDGGVELHEVHRFPNRPKRDSTGTLRWDIASLYDGACSGLRRLARKFGTPASIGIDSWAVDYALLGRDGELLADPVHYRDQRNGRTQSALLAQAPAEKLFARTGIAPQPFNTICQLYDDARTGLLDRATAVALIPDLFGYWLTGRLGTELTNASTTQLLAVGSDQWDDELAAVIGLDLELWAPLRRPGQPLGPLRDGRGVLGSPESPPVITVASHDTASAVAAVPAAQRPVAFVATGTWSLVGLELDEPVVTEAALRAGFTNERGLGDKVRFLKNVNGFWLLEQYLDEIRGRHAGLTREHLLAAAVDEPITDATFDVDSPLFGGAGPMVERVREACRREGGTAPATPPAMVRCILVSMAAGIARALSAGTQLSGACPEEVHLVGGGARDPLFCQLVADAVQRPLTVGPVEATAWGNVLVQAQALGRCEPGLTALRDDVRRQATSGRYLPRDRAPVIS